MSTYPIDTLRAALWMATAKTIERLPWGRSQQQALRAAERVDTILRTAGVFQPEMDAAALERLVEEMRKGRI